MITLAGGNVLPVEHTCHGAGHSPPLSWSRPDLPEGTSHLAWVVRSPSGISWAAWDAPVSVAGLPERFPAAHAPPLQGPNFRGRVGWAAPCPPAHASLVDDALVLTSYALSAPLSAPPTLDPDLLVLRLDEHALARSITHLDIQSTR